MAGFLTYGPDRKAQVIRGLDIVSLAKNYHVMEDLSRVTIQKVK